MASVKSTPKDAQVMAALLREMGIKDYEPRVLNQMLEFTYRYVTTVLDDAHSYSVHAKKKAIDVDDVKLAVNILQEKNFTTPPSRELTAEVARVRNSINFPIIRSSVGLRLPPDRFSLTSSNYRLKSNAKKPRTVHTVQKLNVVNPNTSLGNKGNTFNIIKTSAAPLVKTNSTPPVVTVPRQTVTISKPALTSLLKLAHENTSAPVSMSSVSSMSSVPMTIPNSGVMSQVLPSMSSATEVKLPTEITSQKRPYEEDTDYDM